MEYAYNEGWLPDHDEVYNLITAVKENNLKWNDEGVTDITIATNGVCPDSWGYQTGDNSYQGACYSYRHWAVGTIDKDTDPVELGNDLLEQLSELMAYHLNK